MRWELLVPFTVYFVANLGIGLYGRRVLAGTAGQKFVEEYYVGSRSLGPVVLAFTLTTSLASAGTFLGTPALAYREGFVWLIIGIGQMTSGYLMLGLLGKKFAIIGRKVRAFTVSRVLAVRFPHPLVGGGTALLMVFFLLFYMTAQFIGGARIFESLSGVPYEVGLSVMALTTVIYTTMGGFRAVVMTDTLQGAIMLVGVIALFGAILLRAGGLEPLTSAMMEVDPNLLTPDAGGDYSILSIISMTWILLGIATVGLPHGAIRSLSYRDSRALHRGILLASVMMFIFTFLTWFSGAAANAVLGPAIEVPDQVIPLTIIELFPPIVAGVALAAPFAAIMSTVSSMLLVCASGLAEDIYVDAMKRSLPGKRRAAFNRRVTLALGLLVFMMALTPPPFLQLLVFYAIGGLASGLVVPLLCGLYWPRANTAGALGAVYAGTLSYIVMATFVRSPFGIHDVAWSLSISAVAMVVGSLATPPPSKEILETFWGK